MLSINTFIPLSNNLNKLVCFQVVGLLRQLYARDTRRQFCPPDHWICSNIALPVKRSAEQSFRNVGRMTTPFTNFRLQLVPEEGGNEQFCSCH